MSIINRFRINQLCLIALLSNAFFLSSCSKFLEEKPDKSLVIPSTIEDMQALLDNSGVMNYIYPSVLEIAADNYYVTESDWASRSENDRNNYIWAPHAVYNNNWNSPYQTIFYSNLVLDYLPLVEMTDVHEDLLNNIKGSALFFRSYAHWNIAQLYCKPFSSNTSSELGIPLRLNSDFNRKSVRSSIVVTYNQIIEDLQSAARLLPENSSVPTKPNKKAAYGALARVFLSMSDFQNAEKYADSALKIYDTLIDYNMLDTNSITPFSRFNSEILFLSVTPGSGILASSRCKIDSNLINLYSNNDLRLLLFFSRNSDGTYAPKGGYDEEGIYGQHFYGITTGEMYLTRAESRARRGALQSALDDLNLLLEKRWKTGTFMPYESSDPEQVLNWVLEERRKELVLRGLRWTDLRRLNLEPEFAKTLTRKAAGEIHSLPPNDLRYVLLIPQEVITQSGIQQNPR
jgi:tetratricopeptide (TPR) repeat protein